MGCKLLNRLSYADALAAEVKGTHTKHSGMINKLGPLANLGVCKVSTYMFFPWVALLSAIMAEDEKTPNNGWRQWKTGGCSTPITEQSILNCIRRHDASGQEGWTTYILAAGNKAKMTFRCKADEKQFAEQWIMHSILGSQKEDLSLLTWIKSRSRVTEPLFYRISKWTAAA